MKLLALATAATIALAGAASAMTSSQLEIAAQNTLDRFGFSVDAGTLSKSEQAAIFVADNDSDDTRVQVRAAIASVLNG